MGPLQNLHPGLLITPESVFSRDTELGAESGRWVGFWKLESNQGSDELPPGAPSVNKLDIFPFSMDKVFLIIQFPTATKMMRRN